MGVWLEGDSCTFSAFLAQSSSFKAKYVFRPPGIVGYLGVRFMLMIKTHRRWSKNGIGDADRCGQRPCRSSRSGYQCRDADYFILERVSCESATSLALTVECLLGLV